MNDKPDAEWGAEAPPARTRPPLLIALAVLLALEAALMVAVVVWAALIVVTAHGAGTELAGDVALLVIAIVGALWVITAAVGMFRARSWTRGAAVMWQLIQIAVAIGCFQGVTAVPALGWVLLVPSILGILLAVSPQVSAALRRG